MKHAIPQSSPCEGFHNVRLVGGIYDGQVIPIADKHLAWSMSVSSNHTVSLFGHEYVMEQHTSTLFRVGEPLEWEAIFPRIDQKGMKPGLNCTHLAVVIKFESPVPDMIREVLLRSMAVTVPLYEDGQFDRHANHPFALNLIREGKPGMTLRIRAEDMERMFPCLPVTNIKGE
jgi:hypothetical protein